MRRMNVVNRKQALKVVKEIDAFPKVPESYKEQTISGAGVSIIVFVFIAILVISEVKYYTDSDLVYTYDVDRDFDSKLDINIDMTVAMPCDAIGADILDLTGQNAAAFGKLQEEHVQFELTSDQHAYLKMIQKINEYIKNEYHAIHEFLWKSGYTSMHSAMPAREKSEMKTLDGCRLHGTFEVNKVAGNFHVTAGKSIHLPGAGHAHLAMANNQVYNFSHRIDHFSFGKPTPGVVNPLDGDYVITDDNNHMYQYFIQVVPTEVRTGQADMDTYQFSVTEKNRTINHSKGSHGVPGIFVKYDLAPLKITVKEEYKPYWQFLVRLCGIVGGVFATSGLIHGLVGFLLDVICCRFQLGQYKISSESSQSPAVLSNTTYPNPLQDSPQHSPSENFSSNNSSPSPSSSSPTTSLLTDNASNSPPPSWQNQTLLVQNNSQ